MTGTQSHACRRPRHLAVAFLLVGLLPAVFSLTALADVETPVLRIDCMPELGTVEVYGSNISGERASRNFETIPDRIAKKYGIYDISSYFIVEGENEEPPNPRIVGSRTKTIECQLADHQVSIVFEPYIARPCPSDVSIRLTVRIDGTLIVEDLEYRRSCLSRDTVSSFEFEEDGEFISLKGGFDDARKDELGPHFVDRFVLVLRLDVFRPDRRGQDPLSPLRTFEDVVEFYKLSQ